MTKVTVESYQLRVSNASDEARVYDISCVLNVNNGNVGNIDGGMVMKDGANVANFNRWSENNLNVTYMGIDTEAQCAVNATINEFIEAATTLATSSASAE